MEITCDKEVVLAKGGANCRRKRAVSCLLWNKHDLRRCSTGDLITEARDMYDKPNTEVLMIMGAEKRANIERENITDDNRS